MKLSSSLRVVTATSLNIALYAVTGGRYLLLEGRVRGGIFRNWLQEYRYLPRSVARPTTEAELVHLVRSARHLRVFGSGHSFNDGVVSEEVLVSLDDFSGLVARHPEKGQITVRAGTRIRDVVELLAAEGLAFEGLPSHDAQSIGGILSTDVHGTGRSWGFVSDSVVALTLVDGTGAVHRCGPTDELFRAAVGGVGAVGIITEVTVQGVPRFNVEQRTQLKDVAHVRAQLDQLLADHDHLSLYLYPFSDTCQVNTWDRTARPQSRCGDVREFLAISADAWLAATLGNLLAYGRLLPLSPLFSRLGSRLRRGTRLVLDSPRAFNRSIYHLHQELEFTVAFEDTWDVCDRFLRLYEELYPSGLPYTLIEVRFTPEGHDRTLLGAGRDRRSTWVDLISNDSDGYELYYAAAVRLLRELGARPHLGKYCDGVTAELLERAHGDSYRRFLDLVAEHDPDATLGNAFTRPLFGARSVAADPADAGTF